MFQILTVKNWVKCIFLSLCFWIACQPASKSTDAQAAENNPQPGMEKDWQLGPFTKLDAKNPVLEPRDLTLFGCPVRGMAVAWEAKDVFNPATVVRNDSLWMLYRAEDPVGKHAGTSRIGLAVSTNGTDFTGRFLYPVVFPRQDSIQLYEWEGGCEDPRVVEDEEGSYWMTYTGYDGETARLLVARSADLILWDKFGPAFRGKYMHHWSKSGSIVCRQEGSKLIATKINGRYWMYWGDTDIFLASSENLIHWEPLEDNNGDLVSVIKPRPGKFDCQLVEPGPPALIRPQGIVLIYNSRNLDKGGTRDLPPGTYTAGQALLDVESPAQLLDRTENYFLQPEKDYEINGQVGNVVFVEGLSFYKNKTFLYYGTADSKIAVAVSEL